MIAHFTLATRDVEETSLFFQKALGWQPINRPGNIGRPAAWLQIAEDQELHLIQVVDFAPSDCECEMGRHFAIARPLGEFEELKQKLVAQGAELVEPERETPFERFFFREPNGYVFEIVEANHPLET